MPHLRLASLLLLLGMLAGFEACTTNPRPRYASESGRKSTFQDHRRAQRNLENSSIGADSTKQQPGGDVARRASFLETLPFLPDNARNARLAASISVYLDAGYKYGANGTDAIDCSGFVKAVFQDAFDVSLPRKAVDMYGSGTPVGKLSLETGDLVFFSTERWRVINHVGIYLGERKFVHASTSLGVTISSLDEEYWMRRYIGARRP